MAEDDAQKTEEPTQKKIDKSREKGDVASSQEVKSWGIIIAGALGIAFMAPAMTRDLTMISSKFIADSYAIPFDFKHLNIIFRDIMVDAGFAVLPFFGLLVFASFASNLAQVGLLWAPEKIKPDISKISLLKGLKNKFSLKTPVEFIKGILKLCITALVAFGLTLPFISDLALMPLMELPVILERIHKIALWLFVGTVVVMTVIAALDFMYTKYAYTKQLRMSKQDIKDEHKESDGDPQVKARIRKLRGERAQQRMMAAVPEADVVITNPTHYAVALEYKMENMVAPKLVAKGVDSLAFRIREVAEEHDIPIVENPPLARAIYAAVDLDGEIPEEHFKAVAEVIGYVMRMRGDLPAH